jgi:hypothetical protein
MKKIPQIIVSAIIFSARIPKKICSHVIGNTHTKGHRMMVGIVFIFAGVEIAKKGAMIHNPEYAGLFTDGFGYYLHAIGCMPFLEAMGASDL